MWRHKKSCLKPMKHPAVWLLGNILFGAFNEAAILKVKRLAFVLRMI